MAYVYVITHTDSGKQYVGCTTRTLAQRWNLPPFYNSHIKQKWTETQDSPLYLAIKEYGREAFIIEELEKCENEIRYKREAYWIDKLGTLVPGGYNVLPGSMEGRESRVKKVKVEKPQPKFSKEVMEEAERRHRENMSHYTEEQVKRWEAFEAKHQVNNRKLYEQIARELDRRKKDA